jgi:maleate cis-trans isomerase
MKRYRAGLIIPWMNTALEDELPSLLPAAIGLHWARMVPETWPRDSQDERYLPSMMADALQARRSFTGIFLDEVIVGCTSLAFDRNSQAQLASLAQEEGWVCAHDTIVASWRERRGTPVTLFGPYGADILDRAAAVFVEAGVPIKRAIRIPYSGEIKDIEPLRIVELILKADLPARSTVIVSCSALYTIDIPKRLESHGRGDLHFVSSNLSIADHLIRNSSRRENAPT